MIGRYSLFMALLLVSTVAFGQQNFTLQQCIETALEQNFNLKSTQLQAQTSKVNLQQAWGDILPSLNGTYNLGVASGRSIDPFTNDFINQRLTFSNATLSISTPIFNGFRLKNSIKQNSFNLKASEMEVEEARQNLKLNVTLAYFQLLNALDVLTLAKARAEVTQKQVERLEVLAREGFGNPADYTDMKGQLANDNMAAISAENAIVQARINLFQLLGMDTDENLVFERFGVDEALEAYPLSAEEIYAESLKNLATYKVREFRQEAAKSGVSVAKAGFTPEISLFGQLNTNYSSIAQVFETTGTEIVETGDFVTVDGNQVNVQREQTIFEGNTLSYSDQFDNNLNTAYGISVNIPLFNGFRAKNNVKLSKIQWQDAQVDFENTKLQFKQAIEQSHENMIAAFRRYQVLQEQVLAFQESFRINEIRFNNGVSNIVEYITSKNNMDAAQLNLANARYEYALRVKILDFYRGLN